MNTSRRDTPEDQIAQLAALLRAAAAAHHEAFAATNGEDADWPSWYGGFLAPRLRDALGREFDRAELASDLRRLAADHEAAGATESWPEFYARRILIGGAA